MSVQDALLKSLMTKVNATLESSLRNPGSAHREAHTSVILKVFHGVQKSKDDCGNDARQQ